MKISREEKKVKAVERMKLLGIYPETIQQFEKYGYVSISEPPIGAFFWASDEDKKLIKDFEAKYNVLVYMIVRAYYRELGKHDAYFYISDEKEEWAYDDAILKEHEAFVYVLNHDIPEFSEFGYIGFKSTLAAGLVRTW